MRLRTRVVTLDRISVVPARLTPNEVENEKAREAPGVKEKPALNLSLPIFLQCYLYLCVDDFYRQIYHFPCQSSDPGLCLNGYCSKKMQFIPSTLKLERKPGSRLLN